MKKLLGVPMLAEVGPNSTTRPARHPAVLEPQTTFGEVFTRSWVVELMLDIAEYTEDRDLGQLVIVEPSCGAGAFLESIIGRLIASAHKYGRDVRTLGGAVRAFDLSQANVELARKSAVSTLLDEGLSTAEAAELASTWIETSDFLLTAGDGPTADFVVGNPPYIRLERVSADTMAEYRQKLPTMRGRSDIYIGFFEKGLSLLRQNGTLVFICADRWMRNSYGAQLRELVGNTMAVETIVSMHDVDAFEEQVSAYPAIVALRNSAQHKTAVVELNATFSATQADQVVRWLRSGDDEPAPESDFTASRMERSFSGRALWPTGSPSRLSLIAELEARGRPLQDEHTGTRVGIGLATGCDDVFLTTDSDLVEPDRLLPMAMARDTVTGEIVWGGNYLVNPWDEQGLVDLDRYPRLRSYLRSHEDQLRARYIGRKNPQAWYRTIDRVRAGLIHERKLFMPDLKTSSHPVLDSGLTYPHHNLYVVTSDSWDLEVLGALLLSDLANLFVGAYCVRMRGDCYRFQAQYLRKIRVPEPSDLDASDSRALTRAFRRRDVEAATAIAARAMHIEPSRLGDPK